ncbi:hypothetical protein [Brachybacterium hainanense]|uniref:Uncharacterized protein n=1 Tax=Brachybacterium hainanense TaxID=1541174 RepID=A0ABV6RJQ9_9MICO
MTLPPRASSAHRPAPLRNLPDPPQLPLDSPALALPEQIMLPSRRLLRARLLRAAWMPALVLLPLWYALLTCYVLGTSPTFLLLGSLALVVEPGMFDMFVRSIGFTPLGLGLAYLLVPLTGTLVSLSLLLLSVHRVATINPRMHLTEEDFQRAVSRRAAAPLMILPLVSVIATVLLALTPLSPHWGTLSAGVLAALCAALLWCALAWLTMRPLLSAPRLLDVPTPAEQMSLWDRSTRTAPAADRAARLAVLVTQDRRHLPPVPSRLEPGPAELLARAGRTLAALAGPAMTWVGLVMLPLGWIIFSILDLVVVIERMTSDMAFSVVQAQQPWQVFAVGLPLLAVLAGLVSLAPQLAMLLARPLRSRVLDERTYPDWETRAELNPWEARVVVLTGVLVALEALIITGALAVLLELAGGMTSTGWVWIGIDVLVASPLLGAAASFAMRRRLRDIVYGPAGLYTRRRTPFVLVAPEGGVAPLRPASPEEHLSPYRAADAEAVSRGILPDFGTGGGADASAPTGADPHRIPSADPGPADR